MPAIRLDWSNDDDARRKALYDGDVMLFSERDSVRRFCDYAQARSAA